MSPGSVLKKTDFCVLNFRLHYTIRLREGSARKDGGLQGVVLSWSDLSFLFNFIPHLTNCSDLGTSVPKNHPVSLATTFAKDVSPLKDLFLLRNQVHFI